MFWLVENWILNTRENWSSNLVLEYVQKEKERKKSLLGIDSLTDHDQFEVLIA